MSTPKCSRRASMSGWQTSTARWMTVHSSTGRRSSSTLPRAMRVTSSRSSISRASSSTLRRIISRCSRVSCVEPLILLEHGDAVASTGRQRRAQLVAEHRQEVVLGLAGLLGRGLGLLVMACLDPLAAR